MSRTVLQIPITTSLRSKAELKANKIGFSSLQEVVRVLLTNFTSGTLSIGFTSPTLSKGAETRYLKAITEIKSNKNIASQKAIEKLLQ